MLIRSILPFAIAAATACPAWSQVSTAVPPQTIGTLSTDREPPTDLQQVQQLIGSKRLGSRPSPAAVEQRIEQTARDLGPPGFDVRYGHGLIDAAAALR